MGHGFFALEGCVSHNDIAQVHIWVNHPDLSSFLFPPYTAPRGVTRDARRPDARDVSRVYGLADNTIARRALSSAFGETFGENLVHFSEL